MEVGPLSLEELIEAASSAHLTKIQDAARKVAPKPLKDWRGVWPGMSGNPHGFVTIDYYIEGKQVRVHRAGETEDSWYILSGDGDFAAGHGYRCTLPDVRLYVERRPETWMAIAFDFSTNKIVMEQSVNDSEEGKWHCQVWVNSFRGLNSKLGLLTEALEWEVY